MKFRHTNGRAGHEVLTVGRLNVHWWGDNPDKKFFRFSKTSTINRPNIKFGNYLITWYPK